MLNIISFLIILTTMLAVTGSGQETNLLMNLGLLVLTAYLFSLIMRFFRLPSFLGYIYAGVFLGHNGIGFISDKFTGSITLFEGIFIMVLVSSALKFMVKDRSLTLLSKYFVLGIVSSFGTALLIIGFLAPLPIPKQLKIILGLFAATFSPLTIYALTNKNESYHHLLQVAFGGFICAIVLWGATIAFFSPSHPDRVKLAFMSSVIGLTSTAAGFVWGLVTDKLLYQKSRTYLNLFPITIMFLAYPVFKDFGFDYLFVAIGVGIYFGMISECKEIGVESTELFSIVIFSFFGASLGTSLSVKNVFLLGTSGWSLVIFLTLILIFARFITVKFFMRIFSLEKTNPFVMLNIITGGPLTLIVLRKFIPGFNSGLTSEDLSLAFTICATSMLITVIITTITHVFYKPSNHITQHISC